MRRVNIQEAKTHLSRPVQRAARGEEIIIAKRGKPIAKLVAISDETAPRLAGNMRGKIYVPDDFDAPLPPDVLAGLWGE
jgi:prevent-host-death family protein